MKKFKVGIIIPYFGKFPNYFDLWLKSAEYNKDFDFLIFTDNLLKPKTNNIKVINMTFNNFKNLLQMQVEFPIELSEPYKICDYRPLFGLALHSYLKDYDFWGFGDIDLILGKLNHFITPMILRKYDKIYKFGHLTLLRNTHKNNYLWQQKHHLSNTYRYDEAFRTPYSCHFDEDNGLTQIAKLNRVKEYTSIDFADIDRSKFNFFLLNRQRNVYPSVFEWNDGILKYLYYKNKKIQSIEVSYAHFQKRKMKYFSNSCNIKNIIAVPNEFIINSNAKLLLIKQKVNNEYKYYNFSRRKEIIINIKKRHALQQRVYRALFQGIYRYILDKRRN